MYNLKNRLKTFSKFPQMFSSFAERSCICRTLSEVLEIFKMVENYSPGSLNVRLLFATVRQLLNCHGIHT